MYPVHRLLQPLVCVDVETFMGPTSAQVPVCGACLVARGHHLLCCLHHLSGAIMHTIKRICWIQGLALKLQQRWYISFK